MNTSINCYVFCANITHRLLSYELTENDTTWPLQIMEITLLIAEMKTRNESGCRLYYNWVYPKHQYCLLTIDPTDYREKVYLYFRTYSDVLFNNVIHIMFVGNMKMDIYIYMFMWYKIAFLLSCNFFYCDRIEKQIVFIFIWVLHDSDN